MLCITISLLVRTKYGAAPGLRSICGDLPSIEGHLGVPHGGRVFACPFIKSCNRNTVYLERAIQAIKDHGETVDENLLQHLSPLGWEHINLTGNTSGGKIGKLRRGNSGRYDDFRYLSVLYSPIREATRDLGEEVANSSKMQGFGD